MGDSSGSQIDRRAWRHRWVRRLILAVVAAGVAAVGWQGAGPVVAVQNATVRLVASPAGTSSAADALPVETLTFDEAADALAARPNSGATITLPTTITGLTGTVAGATSATDASTASISFAGTTTSIFGQTFSPAANVLIVIDWDESDTADDDPRVIVSAQSTNTTVGELIGTNGASLAADIPVTVGSLTASDVLDPSIVTGADSAIVPADYPTIVRNHFGRVDGLDLADPLRLSGPLNVHASITPASISPVVAEATGLAAGDDVLLAGPLPVEVSAFPGASPADGMVLSATTDVVLPAEVRDLLDLGSTPIPGSIEVAATGSPTPGDELALRADVVVDPGPALPTGEVDVAIDIFDAGADRVEALLTADLGTWNNPLDSPFLLLDAALAGSVEGPRSAGPVTTAASVSGTINLAGSPFAAAVTGDLGAPNDAQLAIEVDSPIPLDDLLAAIGIDDGGVIPTHVLDANAGPGTVTVRALAGAVTTTFDGEFSLQLQPDVAATIDATVFLETQNDGDDVTVAIRPDTDLRLSDLVPGAEPDFDFNSGGSSFAFAFSTSGIDTTRGELSGPAQRFFGPLFVDGDDTEVEVLPGASSLGLVRLPDNLSGFLQSSFGIEPTARYSGTIPAGAGSNFNFGLELDVDPTFAPEWVESAGLSLDVNAGTAGVGINLQGSLTARFRAGVDPAVADELANLGVDVARDVPVAADHDCRGTAEVLEIATASGTEFRCFDSLTFTVGTALTINPTNVTADLTFTLDTNVMGDDYGWQPFGLSWAEINRLRLEVGIQWDSLAPPPGVALTMGMSGDVTIGGKDLFAAIRLTATPIPAPPFVKVELDGFRFSSDAGFEIDEFFALQHELAVSAAELAGTDPSTVPPPFEVDNIGIPNVALRNLDLSFSLTGATTLCIPQGLFISADLYVDPAGDPTVRGPKCDDTGAPIAPPVGSTCAENQDKGCLAGGRIALTVTGFNADLDLAGFDLGPLQFQQSKLDLKIEPLESHLIMFGGVALDPIGQGQMQMSIERSGLATTASFAGLVEIGPAGSPYLTALAEGTAAFDPAEIQRAGIDFRFVLNAEGLDIDALTDALEASARTAIQQSAQAIVDFLNGLDAQLTAFTNNPTGYVNTQLRTLGVTIPTELQPLIDGVAELAGEGVTATEDMVLRGQLGGAPTGGADKVPECAFGQFLGSDGRCYNVLPAPGIGGVAKQTVCVAPNIFEVGGRCYSIVPVPAVPAGGVSTVTTCPTLTPQLSGGRCYTILPDADGDPNGGIDAPTSIITGEDACPPASNLLALQLSGGRCYVVLPNDGTPDGGVESSVGCPALQPFLSDGRCYSVAPFAGTPSGGAAKQNVCVAPNVQERDGRCYSILATPAAGDAPVGQVCAIPTPFEGGDGRCYAVPPIDTVGLCDAFGALPDVDLPSNCTRQQFFDEVIVPAIYATSSFTQDVASATVDILDALPTLDVECMEFRLTLDSSTTAVTMSITAGIDGDLRTFSLGWDLAQDVGTNLTGLLDALRGGAATGCAPIDLLDFADDVIGTDGGELLKPSIPVPDLVTLAEGESELLFPFANDQNASTSTITGVTLSVFAPPGPVVFSSPSAPLAVAAASPPTSNAGGVEAQTRPDLRSIVFTAVGDLPPGATQLVTFEITSVNSSGITTRSTGSVLLTGRDNPPVTALDLATLDLRAATDVVIDVLANDTDAEDGSPTGLAVVDGGGAAGCPSVDTGQVRFEGVSCDGATPFASLADGDSTVDTFGYIATDSAGNETPGAVGVTVIGRNDAPTIDELRIAPPVGPPGTPFAAIVDVDDVDDGDLLQVAIDWGDGTIDVVDDVVAGRSVRSEHAYAAAGTFTVEVTVTDRTGGSSTESSRVAVRAATTRNTVDADNDGFDSTVDCQDFDPEIFPGATEILDNGIDDNCNGDADGSSTPTNGDGDGAGDGAGGGGGGTGGGDDPAGGGAPPSGPTPLSPTLPTTGSQLLGAIQAGLWLLLAGAVLFAITRRRRSRPEPATPTAIGS